MLHKFFQNECLEEWVISQIYIFLLIQGSNCVPTCIPRYSSFFWVARGILTSPSPLVTDLPVDVLIVYQKDKHASDSLDSKMQVGFNSKACENSQWEWWFEWFQVRQPSSSWTVLWLQPIVVIEHMFCTCFAFDLLLQGWGYSPKRKEKSKRTGRRKLTSPITEIFRTWSTTTLRKNMAVALHGQL